MTWNVEKRSSAARGHKKCRVSSTLIRILEEKMVLSIFLNCNFDGFGRNTVKNLTVYNKIAGGRSCYSFLKQVLKKLPTTFSFSKPV